MPSGNHHSTTERLSQKAARRAWLEARPALLARLPSANDDVGDGESEALDEAVRGLKLVKLYAASTAPINARWGVRMVVAEIRGESVSGQDPKYRGVGKRT
jgi:hypothetical protein